jgi:hypothetical protein
MHEGTMNEEPTADAFSLEPMVAKLYKVGLLQCNEFPFVAVSPDGPGWRGDASRSEDTAMCLRAKASVIANLRYLI